MIRSLYMKCFSQGVNLNQICSRKEFEQYHTNSSFCLSYHLDFYFLQVLIFSKDFSSKFFVQNLAQGLTIIFSENITKEVRRYDRYEDRLTTK